MSDPADELSPLQWCLTAMNETAGRLSRIKGSDRVRGSAAVGEAVWWVTIVDATMLRHHPQAYDRVLAATTPAERGLIEGTLGGLRFLRNQIGGYTDITDFINLEADGSGEDRMTGWRWRQVAEPAVGSLTPRGQEWELTRYAAYQEHLAGQAIGATFGRAVAFLNQTAAKAALTTRLQPDPHAQRAG